MLQDLNLRSYEIGVNLLDLVDDQKFRKTLFNQAFALKERSAVLTECLRKSQHLKSTSAVDAINRLAESFSYHGDNYTATVHIPNLDGANLDYLPIVKEIEDSDGVNFFYFGTPIP